jgi:hypothetical protein
MGVPLLAYILNIALVQPLPSSTFFYIRKNFLQKNDIGTPVPKRQTPRIGFCGTDFRSSLKSLDKEGRRTSLRRSGGNQETFPLIRRFD